MICKLHGRCRVLQFPCNRADESASSLLILICALPPRFGTKNAPRRRSAYVWELSSVNSKVIHRFFAPSTVLVMAISAPKYPGCSVNGTSTGSCCAVFPVTFSEGLTTCQTSAVPGARARVVSQGALATAHRGVHG
ncbi:hypothetical protein L1887_47980 [Cichorium endivia]|nr:hypothetical protein L1887_47980 [Cichorium endivia]